MLQLLNQLCEIHSPSGEERQMKEFLLEHIRANQQQWRCQPQVIEGEELMDCLILVFGDPKCAAFAHMDTTGFTVRYQDQLIPIGGPEVRNGDILIGKDHLGEIECHLKTDKEGHIYYNFGRGIETGTSLTFKPNFVQDSTAIRSPYLDNRIGIYNLLKLAEVLENGILVFSAWEEQGGGSVPFLLKYLYERYKINKALISDVTWVTDGVKLGEGVVVSYRDQNIPRKQFPEKISKLCEKHKIKFQIEVEAHGSSDGREIQLSPYPIDWCFVGAAVSQIHSSSEMMHLSDLHAMNEIYKVLFREFA